MSFAGQGVAFFLINKTEPDYNSIEGHSLLRVTSITMVTMSSRALEKGSFQQQPALLPTSTAALGFYCSLTLGLREWPRAKPGLLKAESRACGAHSCYLSASWTYFQKDLRKSLSCWGPRGRHEAHILKLFIYFKTVFSLLPGR